MPLHLQLYHQPCASRALQ
ncbi:hypothetical protein D030_4028A, partial [Vibrio parahaemolyticus AQ3810]